MLGKGRGKRTQNAQKVLDSPHIWDRQKAEQSNADYHEDFMAMLEVIEEYGGAGSMTHFPNMLKREIEADGTDMSNATNEQVKEGKKTVREKFLAALMLSGANGAKYNDLKRGMKENFVTGTSTYPESPEAVLRILNAYVPPTGWNKRRQEAATTLYEDNDACTAMGNAQKPTTRTRHMDIKYFSICEWVERDLMHVMIS